MNELDLHNYGERAKNGKPDGEGLRRNNTGKNYLAICVSLSAALDLYIEILRHPRVFSAYSGACSVMGRLLHNPAMTNEEKANIVRYRDGRLRKINGAEKRPGLHR
jgi:hypothetical protein